MIRGVNETLNGIFLSCIHRLLGLMVKTTLPDSSMIGFSFSPGGLLLPYHLGVLASLAHHGYVTPETHLAGSSAGAIAVAAHACKVPPMVALEASIQISQQCNPVFLAKGQLMPTLQEALHRLLPPHANTIVNERPGVIGLAHLELYPRTHPVLQTQQFATRECLIDAVCDSSMFPYFTSNKPFRWVQRPGHATPRVVVDGFFTEPLWRFGCPDLEKRLSVTDAPIDRCVNVSVFPMELVDRRLAVKGNAHRRNVISPKLEKNVFGQIERLGRLACSPGDPKELMKLYDEGWADAQTWIRDEDTL
jgi:hypothetical protein